MEIMEDTIAAIATAVSEAGISIVRISGKQAIEDSCPDFPFREEGFCAGGAAVPYDPLWVYL